jgi:hypothetical protein
MASRTQRGQAAIELIIAATLIFSFLAAFTILTKEADQQIQNRRFRTKENMRWSESDAYWQMAWFP